MRAYHFLRADMRSGMGDEPPWKIGETRDYAGAIKLCRSGYHHSPRLIDALQNAPGPVACIVEVSDPIESDRDKAVSRSRKLVAAVNMTRELRLFACDEAEKFLEAERDKGREPDQRSWDAIKISRAFANGETAREVLTAAGDATSYAARATARYTAWAAARAVAWYTISDTSWDTGKERQNAALMAYFEQALEREV